MSDFSIKIGFVIRSCRVRLGLTQETLAAMSGLNRSYVGEIERGVVEVSAINLHRIAEALGLRLSELITLYEQES